MKTSAASAPVTAWVHPFERIGLGIAPFKVVGYSLEKYQACPGAPIQCGASCDVCGASIMRVCRIQGADGRIFKTGCDCVAKAGDTELSEGLRQERRAWEADQRRQEREAAWVAGAPTRIMREKALLARRHAAAERNATAMAWILEGAAIVAASANVSDFDRAVAEMVYRELTGGEREGITDREWRTLAMGYAAALLPASAHVGADGERVRGLVALYEGGPTIGVDSTYGPSVLAKLRVLEGPQAGAVLVWKTKRHPAPVGAVVTLTGTVERHDAYQGVAQTRVMRCKVAIVNQDRCEEGDRVVVTEAAATGEPAAKPGASVVASQWRSWPLGQVTIKVLSTTRSKCVIQHYDASGAERDTETCDREWVEYAYSKVVEGWQAEGAEPLRLT